MKYNLITSLILSFLILFCLAMWLIFPVAATIIYSIMGVWIAYEFWKAPEAPEGFDD